MKRYISSNKEEYYTDLLKIIDSIGIDNLNYNWLITDIEVSEIKNKNFKELFDNKYVLLKTIDLVKILKSENFQWIWGVFSLIPLKYSDEEILRYDMPYAINNEDIYNNLPKIQHPLAEIEIDAIDSSSVHIVTNNNKILQLFKKIYSKVKEY